jgi:hypothetical protein
MVAVAALFLTALTFASLAYATDRKGHYTIAAMLAGIAWLFAVVAVLLCVMIWVWR